MARIEDFVAGERVGATRMNGLLAGVIHTFADTAERDAEFTAPVEGNPIVLIAGT